MRCPYCGFENASSEVYCEQCGLLLQNNTQYEADQSVFITPPPYSPEQVSYREFPASPTEQSAYQDASSYTPDQPQYTSLVSNILAQPHYTAPPPPPSNGHNTPLPPPIISRPAFIPPDTEYGAHEAEAELLESQAVPHPGAQSLLARVIRGLVYFLALLIAATGLLIALFAFQVPLLDILGLVLWPVMLVAGIVLFIVVQARRRVQRLHFPQFLLGLFAATCAACIAFVVDALALVNAKPLLVFVAGLIIMLYGLGLAAIALL